MGVGAGAGAGPTFAEHPCTPACCSLRTRLTPLLLPSPTSHFPPATCHLLRPLQGAQLPARGDGFLPGPV